LEVTEPVRWAFCLALAGFVMLEWMYQWIPANPDVVECVFSVGVEDRPHLYLGFLDKGHFLPATEWN
jgi:hypothetical protein